MADCDLDCGDCDGCDCSGHDCGDCVSIMIFPTGGCGHTTCDCDGCCDSLERPNKYVSVPPQSNTMAFEMKEGK